MVYTILINFKFIVDGMLKFSEDLRMEYGTEVKL